jgi:phosphatidylglycerophosphate synthase
MHRAALPNCVTTLRLLLVPPLVVALYRYEVTWVIALLSAAMLSDLLDGWLARRWGVCTPRGAYFDATVDFALVFAAFAVLVLRGLYPAWLLLVVLLMFAQFIVTARGGQLVYDPVGKYYGSALYGTAFALVLLPNMLLSLALLLGIVGLSAVSLGSRALHLLCMARA